MDLIRQEIEKSDKSRYVIARESGVLQSQLSRFMQGKALTCESAEKLLEYFGYELRKRKGTK